ncbi:lipoyl synthase [Desulfonatronovibrio magnus]|uniref:lipoyl synthase n=1 Tax=Desulfonatronovibrio magnus TaxID=698827 RepID=UPI0005EB6309|nr:lipoyl synthase [Desulfonatronovibrio magnus]
MKNNNFPRKPPWLRVPLPVKSEFTQVDRMLADAKVHTVCRNAACPNIYECFSRKVATFMILGDKCTRGCTFCNVGQAKPEPVDPSEPQKISQAVSKLGLKHIVITSTTRDDLKDGGSGQFAAVLHRLKQDHPRATLEVLIPDFQGSLDALETVMAAKPDVIGHNLETIRRLYLRIRPGADYEQSLGLLRHVDRHGGGIAVKTGIMAGLGETDDEILQVLEDTAAAGVHVVTIGQYLRPSMQKVSVKRFVPPEKFAGYKKAGEEMGLKMVCGPLVRSSYHADRIMNQ